MKQFSLLVSVPESNDSEHAKEINPQWDELVQQWKWEGICVKSYSFPESGYTISGVDKARKQEFTQSDGLKTVSNVIIQAYTMQDALALAKSCPVLLYGGAVEVREIPQVVEPVLYEV
jgi:hypothetical protein